MSRSDRRTDEGGSDGWNAGRRPAYAIVWATLGTGSMQRRGSAGAGVAPAVTCTKAARSGRDRYSARCAVIGACSGFGAPNDRRLRWLGQRSSRPTAVFGLRRRT